MAVNVIWQPPDTVASHVTVATFSVPLGVTEGVGDGARDDGGAATITGADDGTWDAPEACTDGLACRGTYPCCTGDTLIGAATTGPTSGSDEA